MTDDFPAEILAVLKELSRCIEGLGPYQADAILTGGLVPVLYRRVLNCAPTGLPSRTTFDLDWTLPSPLKVRGATLHERMLQRGVVPRKSGSEDLPVVQYVPTGGTTTGTYVEFLTPRRGGKQSRAGKNQGIVEVQSDLHAQTDPYLGLLLAEPIVTKTSAVPELQLAGDHVLQLPNPISFIVQKTLIRQNRGASKQENDLCHIYDVAILTVDIWAQLRGTLERLLEARQFPRRWIPNARASLQSLFATQTSPGPLAISRNYSGLVSEAEAVRAMTAFFAECWQ